MKKGTVRSVHAITAGDQRMSKKTRKVEVINPTEEDLVQKKKALEVWNLMAHLGISGSGLHRRFLFPKGITGVGS